MISCRSRLNTPISTTKATAPTAPNLSTSRYSTLIEAYTRPNSDVGVAVPSAAVTLRTGQGSGAIEKGRTPVTDCHVCPAGASSHHDRPSRPTEGERSSPSYPVTLLFVSSHTP